MSVVTQFLQQGAHFLDPRLLPQGYGESPSMGVSDLAGSYNYLNGAAGWASVNSLGTSVDTNYSADTFKTLLSVTTQAGYVSAVFGPKMTTATDTTTFRITIDGGTAVSIAIVGAGTSVRCWLGLARPIKLFSTANSQSHGWALASDKMRVALAPAAATEDPVFVPVQNALATGVGLLKFTSSLLVECKTTQAQANTGAQERQSGLLWQRMY